MLLQRNFTDSAARSNGFGKQRFQYSRVVFPSGFVLGPRPSAAAISKAPLHPVNISHDRQNEGFCFSRAHFSLISLISNNTRYPPPPFLPSLTHSQSSYIFSLARNKTRATQTHRAARLRRLDAPLGTTAASLLNCCTSLSRRR